MVVVAVGRRPVQNPSANTMIRTAMVMIMPMTLRTTSLSLMMPSRGESNRHVAEVV